MPEPIVVARAGDGLVAHFPDVVSLGGGRLLAAFREGTGHLGPHGRISVVDSEDGGRSWGEPRVAVDGSYDDRDPKLARLADGTVLLSYFVIDWSGGPRHTTHGTFVRRSEDGGRTWGEPVVAGMGMTGGGIDAWHASHGAVVELPGGDLLYPIYGHRADEKWWQASAVRSSDGGRSWGGEVTIAAGEGINFQEPTLTVVGDEVVSLIRTDVVHAYLSRSSDGGRTWSEPKRTDMPASSHHALPLSTGEVLVTYGDVGKRFAERRLTVGRLVRDPAGDWDGYPDVLLYDSGHPDQANPSSAEVAPGRFLTLGFDVPAATVVGVFTEAADFPS
ncbi:glycoside hydrolase [Actinoplanes sp. KI2]|uniref:sialidase family protein n=1 Tax=Actinoplanes sp. KI2 TaxID=2983315 RepID=UPI0021D5B9F4|nr:sialidase family protein [Actinoplanes sp. KI2]MCU7725654.1 glycoside hydrolase [Actinoplanes sp. KI2]